MAFFGIGGADFEFIRHIFLSGVTDITVCRNRTDGLMRVGSADGSAGYLGVVYTTYYIDYQYNYD